MRESCFIGAIQLDSQCVRNFASNLLFDGAHVTECAAVFLPPHLGIRGRVDQFGLNIQGVAALQHSSGQQDPHVQLMCHGHRIDFYAPVPEGCATRHDPQFVNFRKMIDQAFGDAVAQIIGVFAVPRVDKREHRDRIDDVGSSARCLMFDKEPKSGRGGGGGRPFACLFRQASRHEAIQLGGSADTRWRVVENRGHRFSRRRPGKRGSAGRYFVKHRSQREDVAGSVGRVSPNLLGRHVGERPQNRPRRRFHGGGHRQASHTVRNRRTDAGQSEIQDLHLTVSREKNVFRLQIAVDDAFRVRGIESICDGRPHFRRFNSRTGRTLYSLPQCFPLQQFHHGETDAPFLPKVKDHDDIGVREGGDGHGLALEPRPGSRVVGEMMRQDFDSHLPAQPYIARAIDLTHPPASNGHQDFVRSQSGPGR